MNVHTLFFILLFCGTSLAWSVLADNQAKEIKSLKEENTQLKQEVRFLRTELEMEKFPLDLPRTYNIKESKDARFVTEER